MHQQTSSVQYTGTPAFQDTRRVCWTFILKTYRNAYYNSVEILQ